MAISNQISSKLHANLRLELKRLIKDDSNHTNFLNELFYYKIAPLYGPQSEFLQKIKINPDLKCRILYEEKIPVGVLVFQNSSNKCLEVEMLYASDPKESMNRNQYLVKRIFNYAEDYEVESISVKISKLASDVLGILKNNGFSLKASLDSTFIFSQTLKKASNDKDLGEIKSEKRKFEATRMEYEETKKRKLNSNEKSQVEASIKGKEGKMEQTSSSENNAYEGLPRIYSSISLKEAQNRFESKDRRTSTCPIKQPYFDLIKNGRKTVEGRINTGMFRNLKTGEFLKFTNRDRHGNTDEVICEITKINKYVSFFEMLNTEGVAACLPDISSVEQGVHVYDSIPGFPQRAKQFGVLAIHISKLRKS